MTQTETTDGQKIRQIYPEETVVLAAVWFGQMGKLVHIGVCIYITKLHSEVVRGSYFVRELGLC